jgi:hypothetical protein
MAGEHTRGDGGAVPRPHLNTREPGGSYRPATTDTDLVAVRLTPCHRCPLVRVSPLDADARRQRRPRQGDPSSYHRCDLRPGGRPASAPIAA